nr:HTH-containing DNA-binding protein [Marseillevirus cajuinensis]
MEEESLLQEVLNILAKEHKVVDVVVKKAESFYAHRCIGERIDICAPDGKKICSWVEAKDENDAFVWAVYGVITKREKVLEFVAQQLDASSYLFRVCRERAKKLEAEIAELLLENKRLRDENTELLFSPGGRGALEAQQHFESLV